MVAQPARSAEAACSEAQYEFIVSDAPNVVFQAGAGAGKTWAGVCKALIRYEISDECIGCTLCAQACPADAIAMRAHEVHEVDHELCVKCGTCVGVCPIRAVHVTSAGALTEGS